MELDLTSPIVLSHQHHAESFPLRSSHTDNTYYSQIGAIVCLLVLAVGFTLLKPTGKATKEVKSTPKKTPKPSILSPASTKKAAKGAGSVATPAGRRSARIARKSMDKDS
eukprot:scaffold236_cov138-Skeletonema_marinoi.AAC.1